MTQRQRIRLITPRQSIRTDQRMGRRPSIRAAKHPPEENKPSNQGDVGQLRAGQGLEKAIHARRDGSHTPTRAWRPTRNATPMAPWTPQGLTQEAETAKTGNGEKSMPSTGKWHQRAPPSTTCKQARLSLDRTHHPSHRNQGSDESHGKAPSRGASASEDGGGRARRRGAKRRRAPEAEGPQPHTHQAGREHAAGTLGPREGGNQHGAEATIPNRGGARRRRRHPPWPGEGRSGQGGGRSGERRPETPMTGRRPERPRVRAKRWSGRGGGRGRGGQYKPRTEDRTEFIENRNRGNRNQRSSVPIRFHDQNN